MTPASFQRSAQWPTTGRTTDAGDGKCGKNKADHESGTAEVGDVKRQDRRKHGMLRVAEKLRRAQQQKSARPDGLGFCDCHASGDYKADSIGEDLCSRFR